MRSASTAVLAVLLLVATAAGCGGDGEEVQATTPATRRAIDVKDQVERVSGTAKLVPKANPSADYPLDTCVVSGEPLDSMGGPVVYDYGGVEVRFCCENCVKEFEAAPQAHLEKIERAR